MGTNLTPDRCVYEASNYEFVRTTAGLSVSERKVKGFRDPLTEIALKIAI